MPTAREQTAASVAEALVPLADALESGDAELLALVAELGWTLPSVPPALSGLSAASQNVTGSLGGLAAALEADADGTGSANAVAIAFGTLTVDLLAFAAAIRDLPAGLRAQLPAPFVAATQIDTEFVPRLFDHALDARLEASVPMAEAVLALLGLIDRIEQPADPARFQPPFVQRTLRWDRLPRLFSHPESLLRDLYGWGTPTINTDRLFDALLHLSFHVVEPAVIRYPNPARSEALGAAPGAELPSEMVFPLFVGGGLALGVEVSPLPPPAPGAAQPLALTLVGTGTLADAIPLSPAVSFRLEGGVDFTTGLSMVLRPGQAPQVQLGAASGAASPFTHGRAAAQLILAPPPGTQRLEILNILEGTGIDAERITFAAGVEGTSAADLDPVVDAAIERGRLVLGAGGRDSFLNKLMPSEPLALNFDVGLAWSRTGGVHLRGSGGIETTLSLHSTLGPFVVESVRLGLAVSNTALDLEASMSGSGRLGPVTATVDRLGARLGVEFRPGNVGPVDLTPRFKPPNGLGIAIDASVVKGGGYIFFDPERGEYSGVLELSLKDTIQLKAVGLLTTRLPDGRPGFSFLVIITAEFPPLQLGFGFTLNGVGGLVGINRTMVIDTLRSGLRSHTLDSVLFPADPVRNASRIISDLRTVFPPAEDRFVFGPMLRIGWGTPTIVTATLGLVLEVPAPIRLAILGQIRARLPSEDTALVRLHMDVLGVIEFERKTLSIDATIYDSSILIYALEGDMALRLNWGDQPAFALSIGGLNPRFQPPPGFPQLRRLTLSMGSGNNPRLAAETYMALTSNSVQFGARLDLFASAAGFSVHGFLGFDVLVVLSPFSFTADMEAGVDLLRGSSVLMSIHLEFTLSGPTPWRAVGHASIRVLFFSVSVGFDVSWGDRTQATLPPADAREPLLQALADSRNWRAALPPGEEQGVSLGPGTAPADTVVVHPLGGLSVRQTVVPLGVTLSRFGSAEPERWRRFEIRDVQLDHNPAERTPLQDRFARGQFFELSDEDKLSKPAFEPMDAGVAIGTGAHGRAGHVSGVDVRYETVIVDDIWEPPRRLGLYLLSDAVFAAKLQEGAAALSQVRTTGERKYMPPGLSSAVETRDLAHVIASTADLTIRPEIVTAAGTSQIAAELALQDHVARHPEDAGSYQVVPRHEAVVAA